ncbi:hypothetical protein [Sphingomonas sp. LHG3406-1]|uniref:hypothetical protein n=1 Tax=Sphingomonas sp. LHG3406-1 TaxID=2804617 RepID=UPI00261007F5|nr:hypothetical protein [Sphingomonas sp. LHG3406-1]
MQDTLERTASEDAFDSVGPAGKALIGAAAGAVGTWALDRADWRMWNSESAEARGQTSEARPGGEPPAQVLATRVGRASASSPRPTSMSVPATSSMMASESRPPSPTPCSGIAFPAAAPVAARCSGSACSSSRTKPSTR